MAKLSGVLKLVGTLGGLTIYKSQDGYIVKEKRGPSGAKIKSDPAYKAVRQQQIEFGACTKAGKLLRDTLMPVLEGSIDNRVSSRLNSVMNSVKNSDNVSKPGKRVVKNGFATTMGCSLLKDFEFNKHSSVARVLTKPYAKDLRKGKICIEALAPKKDLKYPKGSTHVVFQCGLAVLDFDRRKSTLKEDSVVLPLSSQTKDLVLSFDHKSSMPGLKVLILKVAFCRK